MAETTYKRGQLVKIKDGVVNPLENELQLGGQVVTIMKISNPNSENPTLLVEFKADALDQWPQYLLEEMIVQHPKWDQCKLKASDVEIVE
ncbi:hypothetical protein [Persicobacter psychrovividus]|uniref:Uncharacterized protein n=1 Tax=Persicobacter psychrovividus TaxID=387638 RepID=A0ABM7VDV1_9BACT|nr:hypothetical protein PEPS_11230 [Persicobacter psychrovividus]